MKLKRGLVLLGLVFVISAMIWLSLPSPNSRNALHMIKLAMSNVVQNFGASGRDITLKEACLEQKIPYPPKNIHIVVDKSEFRLYLYSGDKLIKSYPVNLGKDPVNDKIKEGDGRTPEGEFYVCQKTRNPSNKRVGSRWMRLSYPNKEDAERGVKSGLISASIAPGINEAINERQVPPQRTPLGGGVGIHGGIATRHGVNVPLWTSGCVALYDRDVEEFYDFVPVGAGVLIRR